MGKVCLVCLIGLRRGALSSDLQDTVTLTLLQTKQKVSRMFLVWLNGLRKGELNMRCQDTATLPLLQNNTNTSILIRIQQANTDDYKTSQHIHCPDIHHHQSSHTISRTFKTSSELQATVNINFHHDPLRLLPQEQHSLRSDSPPR